MGRLSTHILDTANGRPAAGVRIRLYASGEQRKKLADTVSNDDGRTAAALLEGDALQTGPYELEFDIGEYFAAQGHGAADCSFLDTVVIRINLSAGERYHVPLLVSPWCYTTYRGS